MDSEIKNTPDRLRGVCIWDVHSRENGCKYVMHIHWQVKDAHNTNYKQFQ